jgi:hypothetical protein
MLQMLHNVLAIENEALRKFECRVYKLISRRSGKHRRVPRLCGAERLDGSGARAGNRGLCFLMGRLFVGGRRRLFTDGNRRFLKRKGMNRCQFRAQHLVALFEVNEH